MRPRSERTSIILCIKRIRIVSSATVIICISLRFCGISFFFSLLSGVVFNPIFVHQGAIGGQGNTAFETQCTTNQQIGRRLTPPSLRSRFCM